MLRSVDGVKKKERKRRYCRIDFETGKKKRRRRLNRAFLRPQMALATHTNMLGGKN